MPIYEFYCADCHTVFNFFSRSVNTGKIPDCPRCRKKLARQMSAFSVSRKTGDSGDEGDLPFDEARMEKAMAVLEKETAGMDDNDPVASAALVRKLADAAGVGLGESMEEALARMESGEDPESVEQDMAGLLDDEPFVPEPGKKIRTKTKTKPPQKDETLYDL